MVETLNVADVTCCLVVKELSPCLLHQKTLSLVTLCCIQDLTLDFVTFTHLLCCVMSVYVRIPQEMKDTAAAAQIPFVESLYQPESVRIRIFTQIKRFSRW